MAEDARNGNRWPVIHRVAGQAMPVNAYLVELENAVVLIDGLLTVSDARALRRNARRWASR